MNFGEALRLIKDGKFVSRGAMRSNGFFLFKIPTNSEGIAGEELLGVYELGALVQFVSLVAVGSMEGHVGIWLPSQEDLMAEDWEEVVRPVKA